MTAAECRNCKASGFPNQMIDFVKDGLKPDGSSKYRVINPDKSLHQHKKALETITPQPQQQNHSDEGAKRGHEENLKAWEKLTAAIQENTKVQITNAIILDRIREHTEILAAAESKRSSFEKASVIIKTDPTAELVPKEEEAVL